MRLGSLVLVALLAGCLGPIRSADHAAAAPHAASDSPGAAVAQASPPSDAPRAPAQSQANASVPRAPPPPMHWEGRAALVAVSQAGPWPECDGLNGCDGPFFSIDAPFDLAVTLAWDRPTDDLDLHLCRWVDMRCDEVSHDGVNGGPELATRQVLHQDGLPAGYYRLWIVPQHGVAIDYTLDAVFRQPGA